ncbi:unnamed protein product [Paramecium sonneborni]|uniref:Uncharacterized protein n=1 Tax=Paramecium sonneborni TaxID=65129 RepID=A0A8S1PGZ0_9CILI|nr:unnamed protein product [Paramecium sonneborni]
MQVQKQLQKLQINYDEDQLMPIQKVLQRFSNFYLKSNNKYWILQENLNLFKINFQSNKFFDQQSRIYNQIKLEYIQQHRYHQIPSNDTFEFFSACLT